MRQEETDIRTREAARPPEALPPLALGPGATLTPELAEAVLRQIAGLSLAPGTAPRPAVRPAKTDPWRSELRYRALVERIPAITFVAALDGVEVQELYISPQIEALLGFSQEEWLADPILWYNQLHPDDRDRWVAEFANTCATGANFQSEYRLLKRDGGVVWVHGECQIVQDENGHPAFLQGIAFDITASKRAQEVLRHANDELEERVRRRTSELARSEGRLRAIVETAADGIFTADERGRISSFNPAATRMFGYAPEEVLGRGVDVLMPGLRPVTEEAAPADPARADAAGPLAAPGRELVGRRKDGTSFPVELSVGETVLDDRRIYTGLVRDVSERRQAESRLEEMNKRLLDASRRAGMAEVATGVLHNVGNVLNSVNTSSSLIAEALRKPGVGHLARVVALLREHQADLGTFLTAHATGRQVPPFLGQLADHLVEERTACLGEVVHLQKNIDHIREIVSTQQAYAGAAGLVEQVDLRELMEDALRIHRAAINRHDICIVTELADVPPVLADKHKVLQILVNLISNAKHAMSQSPTRTLTLRLEGADGRVRVSVRDTGCGIAVENLTRIFAHGFTTRRDGHGFGLHSGALAARELGGSLQARSDGPGTGALFTLELPIAPRGALAA